MAHAWRSFSSDPRSAAPARRFVVAFARSVGCTAKEVDEIELAFGEIMANAVEHGHSDAGVVIVACEKSDGTVGVTVKDTGRGFSRSVRNQRREDSRGLGLMIARRLTDELRVRRAQRGAVVQFSKECSGRPLHEGGFAL